LKINTAGQLKYPPGGPRPGVIEGLNAALPICLGYLPIGLAFGVLARQAGLTPPEIGLMSILVYAGSSQFIGAAMLQTGAASLSIILTTFFINLRHLLMSAALSTYLGRVDKKVLPLYAYGITDESFGVNLNRFHQGNWGIIPALAVNHATNLTWIASTVAGGLGGGFIPAGAFGLDFALIAMFLCLLVLHLRNRRSIVVALMAAGLSVILSILLPGNTHIILAASTAATLGVVFKKRSFGEYG
jgi:4-azaleucine resistance transporter AzlC